MQESKLSQVELFAGLSPRELRRLSTVTDEIMVPPGTLLLQEGRFAHEFLLIVTGTAEVRRGEEHVADLGPGDFAGEIGAIHDVRRNATVVASSEMTVIVMTARDLREVAAEMPSVSEQIEAAAAARAAPAGS
jgi:CRP-like cAMP-binding protein